MIVVGRAKLSDREEIQKLVGTYHASEGLIPMPERIAWAVDQRLRGLFPGLMLVASDDDTMVGVALAVYQPSAELGRVIVVNDFFVMPAYRRKGAGRELAKRLVEECKLMQIDEINLEVISGNEAAPAFWQSLGFEVANRVLFKLKLT